MLFSSITRTRKVKKFSFSPRYYDEEKERLKERYAEINADLDSTIRSVSSGNLKEKWQRNKKTSNFEKKSNVRLVFIVTILIALCYWILYL